MGDLQSWASHQNNGGLSDFNLNFNPSPTSPSPQPSNPRFSEIKDESWQVAERATEGVVETIQATAVSERRRQEVVEYVQRLIKGCLGCEVFPFGSVPLKTYLPDGDIDLTAIGIPNSEDSLAYSVRHVLETEEQNNDAEFEVKDVQYINAEVKLVKCLVQNIVVDISFNQSGGLSTLCFLERVDRKIGKDHLFKRSVILIKAWCYYESRILGAHHGLISTYALETLVLYIFHLFHSSLDGPLAVLYRFLDYYSKFDWDNFCISLYGPISVSSLPELVAEAPDNDGVDLLFTKEFLRNCVDNFWVVPRGFESNSRNFPHKHLNIVDPLRDNNNLGRSVSKGNFYRIRSAFSYGARKLGRILVLPYESIASEVNTFFANTLDRHGSGERPDGASMYSSGVPSSSSELHTSDASGELCEEMNDIKLLGLEEKSSNKSSNVREKSKAPDFTSEKNKSLIGKALHSENGYHNGESSQSNHLPFNEEASFLCESESSTSSTSWFSTYGTNEQLENSHPVEASSTRIEGNRGSGSSKHKKLADLTADYEMHIRNLLYVKWSQEYISGTIFPFYPQSSPLYQYDNSKNSWDSPRRHRLFGHMNANGVVPGMPFSPTTSSYPTPFTSGNGYGMEDLPKPRGTGTYFPNTNYRVQKERHSPRRGKHSMSANNFSRHHYNNRAETPQEADFPEKSVYEPPPQLQLPVFSGSGRGKSALVDVSHSPRPSLKETTSSSSGIVFPQDGKLEFGSFGPVALGSCSPDVVRSSSSDSGRSCTQGSTVAFPASTVQPPSMTSNRERSSQVYQLKDEGDFPPLTG